MHTSKRGRWANWTDKADWSTGTTRKLASGSIQNSVEDEFIRKLREVLDSGTA